MAVTAGELSPIVTGIVYCNTIAFCRSAYELRRAREWTAALTRWCDAAARDGGPQRALPGASRPDHDSLRGAWQDALDELRRLGERFTEGVLNQLAVGHAAYQQGEVHRLRGEARRGRGCLPRGEPVRPRAAAGAGAACGWRRAKADAAAAAIRRAVGETTQPLKRAALLPAYVEIMLAAGDVEAARSACRELDEIAERQATDAAGRDGRAGAG